MKKVKIALGILVVGVLVISGVAAAGTNSPVGQRVYVLTDNSVAKTILGVNQEFPGVFSTEVSPQLKVLSSLGLIKTEPVQIYEITGKPTCNYDSVCQPELGENPSCADCKNGGEEEPPAERSCYPSVQKPWGVLKVKGGSGGVGVKVAVLDTGVYKDHLDLKANIVDCKDATKRGIKNGCADRNGHGTHVSGTILANGGTDGLGIYGVAPEAKLMAVKVCGGQFCFGDDIAAGIRYVADNGANVISMSLGGDLPDPQILLAVDYAVGKNVLVVAAAGNDGHLDGYGSIDYPAAYIKVVAVGAIDSSDNVAYFTSQGINDITALYINNERDVEFGAPGVSVESTYKDGCYTSKQGTSMSTPHVAGLAAKVWSQAGGHADEVRTYLQERAKLYDLDGPGDDIYTGFGLPTAP